MINLASHTAAKLHIRSQPSNIVVVLCFTLLVWLSGCKVPDKEKDNPLTRRKMVEVLVEMHLLEARADGLMIVRDSMLPEMKIVYDEILKNNKVTEADYKKTLDYYVQNPVKMDTMYQEVVDELSRREALKTGRSATPVDDKTK